MTIDELRALAAPPRSAPAHERHMGMLSSLRQRITVEWLKADALDFFACRAASDDSGYRRERRRERTHDGNIDPIVGGRWRGDGDAPTSQGSAVLHLDRVVYQDVRRISGVSVALQALVQGRDLLFQASLVGPPPKIPDEPDSDASDGDDRSSDDEGLALGAASKPPARRRNVRVGGKRQPTKPSFGAPPAADERKEPAFDLTRLIPEREMVALVGAELGPTKRALFYPHYRGTLAALLATKLKLVNVAGKALKAGDDVATALAGAAVKYLCRSFCLSSPLSRSDRSCSG